MADLYTIPIDEFEWNSQEQRLSIKAAVVRKSPKRTVKGKYLAPMIAVIGHREIMIFKYDPLLKDGVIYNPCDSVGNFIIPQGEYPDIHLWLIL